MERIHTGRVTDVFRTRRDDGAQVIEKVLRTDDAAGRDFGRLRREAEITRHVAGPGVIEVLDFVHSIERCALVVEDFGAHALNIAFRDAQPSPTLALEIGLAVVDALDQVHRRGVIHKDINPSNIVWNAERRVVKLIDFGISTLARRQATQRAAPSELEGTLPYLAPEQTGRIARELDYRADYYALGATLYEVLTGMPPFPATDPLELVHAHVAVSPRPPHERVSSIPPGLSAVVLRLLAKDPDARYQSARGLRADLQACLAHLRGEAALPPTWQPGLEDISSELRLPETLYGRQSELRALSNHVRRGHGATGLALVAGGSGSGKTSLVERFAFEQVTGGAIVISGKFEQFRRGVPYEALLGAMRELARQMSTKDERELAAFRRRVSEALGPNARVVTEVVAELEVLVGRGAPIAELPPAEAENRFRRTFGRFVRSVATPASPLIVFLDDLQWADLPSIQLLESMLVDSAKRHGGSEQPSSVPPPLDAPEPSAPNFPEDIEGQVVVVGAYRSNEVSGSHALRATLEHLEQSEVPLLHLDLRPLEVDDVNDFVADALDRSRADTRALAELCAAKTGGNPFFLRRFFMALAEEELIRFDPQAERWVFAIEAIEARQVTDNVVTLMTERIGELSHETQHALHVAALLGGSFDLEELAEITGASAQAVEIQLAPALAADLLLDRGQEGGRRTLRFTHDRIQQAARTLEGAGDTIRLHAKIGRFLLEQNATHHQDRRLFEITGHLDAGLEFLDEDEREELIELHLRAGRQALRSVAYEPALRAFRAGRTLLPSPIAAAFSSHRDTAWSLTIGAAEAAYLSGDYRAMQEYVADLIAHAETPIAEVRARWIAIRAAISCGQLAEAIDLSLEALARLDVRVPANSSKGAVLKELAQIRWRLGGTSPLARVDDPELTDERARLALEILGELAPPAYLARPEILPHVAFAMVDLQVAHGVSSVAAIGYSLFALVLCTVGDHTTGNAYGELGQKLLARFPDGRTQGRVTHLYYGFVRHWVAPVSSTYRPYVEGFQAASEAGDFVWAAFCAMLYVIHRSLGGAELRVLGSESTRYVEAMLQLGQQHAVPLSVCHVHTVHNLSSETSTGDPCDLGGRFGSEADLRAEIDAQGSQTSLFNLHFTKLLLATYFRRPEIAREATRACAKLVDAVPATRTLASWVFYDGLTLADEWDAASLRARLQIMARVEAARARAHRWARLSPADSAAKAAMLDAAVAEMRGRRDNAQRAYDDAIRLAREHGIRGDEALATERAARFQMRLGNASLGRAYMRDAVASYDRWGAARKVRALLREDPAWGLSKREGSTTQTRSYTGSHSTDRGTDLDALAVIRASQALSEELVRDRLALNLVQLTLQTSGATRALLVIPGKDGLVVDATAEVAGSEVQTQRLGVPLHQYTDSCHAALHFVERTRQQLLLNDTLGEGLLVNDPYVRSRCLRSILALPILHQGGELRAVLYLENRHHRDAFTSERVDLLRLLTAQAAISLENATLYESLQKALEVQTDLTTAHARFVPHQFLRALDREQIGDVRIGDSVEKEMSILFSDIRGFANIVEGLAPTESIAFINSYLRHMEPAIFDNGGFVDSYIGDAIMALFEGEADGAVRAAIAMQHALAALNEQRKKVGAPPVRNGIGINTGELMLGTIGGGESIKCGVIGESVNLAARIESLTKRYGTPLLISEHTHARLAEPSDYALRPIERVVPVGATEPLMLYEVLDGLATEEREAKLSSLGNYTEGVSLYFDRRFANALARFAAVLETNPSDRVAQMYVDRCMTLVRQGVPDDWDGVVHLQSK